MKDSRERMVAKTNKLPAGTVHRLPKDMQYALVNSVKAKSVWQAITPLARNEWICWVTTVKKDETRKKHIVRAIDELEKGKRRPCCWPGCPHRNPAAAKWFGGD